MAKFELFLDEFGRLQTKKKKFHSNRNFIQTTPSSRFLLSRDAKYLRTLPIDQRRQRLRATDLATAPAAGDPEQSERQRWADAASAAEPCDAESSLRTVDQGRSDGAQLYASVSQKVHNHSALSADQLMNFAAASRFGAPFR